MIHCLSIVCIDSVFTALLPVLSLRDLPNTLNNTKTGRRSHLADVTRGASVFRTLSIPTMDPKQIKNPGDVKSASYGGARCSTRILFSLGGSLSCLTRFIILHSGTQWSGGSESYLTKVNSPVVGTEVRPTPLFSTQKLNKSRLNRSLNRRLLKSRHKGPQPWRNAKNVDR